MTQFSQPATNGVFIAVMGVTGAGKSTFINHCTEKRVEIGHDLQACKIQWPAIYYLLKLNLTSSRYPESRNS